MQADGYPAEGYQLRVESGRILIESTDGERRWGTVGVSPNLIEAAWQALLDSVEYKLLGSGAAAP